MAHTRSRSCTAIRTRWRSSLGQFTFPGGKTQTLVVKAGDTVFTPAATHLPENVGDAAFDVVIVELKGKAGKAAKMEMK